MFLFSNFCSRSQEQKLKESCGVVLKILAQEIRSHFSASVNGDQNRQPLFGIHAVGKILMVSTESTIPKVGSMRRMLGLCFVTLPSLSCATQSNLTMISLLPVSVVLQRASDPLEVGT
jgi:hypothetical protein